MSVVIAVDVLDPSDEPDVVLDSATGSGATGAAAGAAGTDAAGAVVDAGVTGVLWSA